MGEIVLTSIEELVVLHFQKVQDTIVHQGATATQCSNIYDFQTGYHEAMMNLLKIRVFNKKEYGEIQMKGFEIPQY